MAGVWLRVSAWARANWARSIPVVLLVALAGGTAMALAAGTRRTDSAPERYTASYGGDPDLILYQPSGPPIADEIRELPGVASVQSITFVMAFPTGRSGGTTFDGVDPFTGDDDLPGSYIVEGRFTDPDSASEFTVTRQAAALMDAHIGEAYEVVSYTQDQIDANAFAAQPEGPTFTATLVGIVGSPTDFDEPSSMVTFSAGLLDAHPEIGIVASIVPVDVAGGSPAAVLEEVRALPFGADVSQLPTELISRSARDAVNFQSRALWIVTLIAAGAAVLVAAQLAARHVRSTTGDREALQALGFSRRQIAAEAAVEGGVIGVAAAAVAGVAAWLASALFPFGVVRGFEPDPGLRADLAVLLFGALALVVLVSLAAAAAGAARHSSRDPRLRTRRVVVSDRLAALGAPQAMVNGVRFALSRHARRGAPPAALIVATGAGVTLMTGALVVGASMARVIDEPFRFGVNYDHVLGNQYQPATGDIVTPLAADPDVEAISAGTIGTLTIGDTDLSVWVFEPVKGDLLPVITAGRAPVADDELALGRRAAREFDVRVGDVVNVTAAEGSPAELTVVGLAVTPDEAGEGATMTYAGYAALTPEASRNVAAVNLRADAPPETLTRLLEVAATPRATITLPASARALDRVTPTPFLLAVVLTLLVIALLAVNLLAAARERARDIAVMRSLGADGRQLGGMLFWHGTTLAVIGLATGVPLGVAIGRRVFTVVANNLGLVPTPHVPPVLLAGIVLGVLLIAVATAALPASRARRTRTTAVLRRS